MKINWNLKKADGLTICSYAFASVAKLIQDIKETGKVDFVVRHATKTSLDIEISCPKDGGRHNFAVAYIPEGAEKFKFHEKVIRGVFDSKPRTRHYFKLTKTQGLAELKEYLAIVLERLVPGTESLDVNLTFYKVPEIEI